MRRLLLFAYHFPPDASIGSLRWARMIPLLRERGWTTDVVAATVAGPGASGPHEPGESRGGCDAARVLRVPQPVLAAERAERAAWSFYDGLRRRRRSRFRKGKARAASPSPAEPQGAADAHADAAPARAAGWPRGDLAWRLSSVRGWARVFWTWLERERYRAWAREAVRALRQSGDAVRYDAVVATSPPHWVQDIVRAYAGRRRTPFVMDLRDPWATTEALLEPVASPLWLRLAEKEEARCARDAVVVAANNRNAAEAFVAMHPAASGKVAVVRNGWDEKNVRPGAMRDVGRTRDPHRFTVVYTGTLYFDRSPRRLFTAAARAIHDVGATPATFCLEIMGRIENGTPDEIRRMAEEEGVGPHLVLHPPGSRDDARRLMGRAAVLVSLPWSHSLAIPAKIYEYMTFPAWLLVLAAADAAPARMLSQSEAHVVDPDDVGTMARVLRDCYDAYMGGARAGPIATGMRFSRAEAVAALVDALERALPGKMEA